MSNPIWPAIVAALKSLVSAIETEIGNMENAIANDVTQLGGLLSALLTAEENQIALDYQADLKQIAVNIQNSSTGLTLSTFIPVFIAAATPVLAVEASKLTAVFWNVVSTYHASNLGITNTPANNGNLPGGNQVGS